MLKLSYKLLELIALSLGLPADRFYGFFKDQTSYIRLNHYPPCPTPELALGVGRHKDGAVLTIVAQDDVGGLEVKRKTDGEWVRVKPTPDAYIINVGDTMQVTFSNVYSAKYKSFIFLLIAKLAFNYQLPEVKLNEKPKKAAFMSKVYIFFENLIVQVYNIFIVKKYAEYK